MSTADHAARRPELTGEALRPAPDRDLAPHAGLIGWLSTVDHKEIGRRYIVTAFVFLVARRAFSAC